MLSILFLAGISLFIWLCLVHYKIHTYFRYKNVPFIPPCSLFGNIKNLMLYRCCFGEQFYQLYNHDTKKDESIVGIHVLHNQAILLRSSKLIKQILISDFSAFANRFETTDIDGDTMGSLNLFFAKYDVWKDIHKIFSPLFSHGRVKLMFPNLLKIGRNLESMLCEENFNEIDNSVILEMKELCARFTTDTIASLAFGIESKCLEGGDISGLRGMCKEVNEPHLKRVLHLFVMFFFPRFAKILRTRLYSRQYEHFMRNLVEYVMEHRKNGGEVRNDLIDIFLQLQCNELNHKESVVNKKDFFAAQAAFLLLAGFDTSSSTISFTLYELAKKPICQIRLRKEITEMLHDSNNSPTYDSINQMPYLRMVVDEVLRLYPPTAFLDRCCTAEKGYSLAPYSNFTIPKGMPIYISVLGLHRDEKFWPKPNEFMPERFSDENRHKITSMSYLPFGNGPRGCIGSILGLMQVKIGLIYILKNYYITPCKKTAPEMCFDPKTFVLTANQGTYLRFVKDPLIENH
ncbi:probable cytochrome P450 6t1 [Teleopsis dalmanni]|uniref:probable cytochrome P450 6t1 n=1 Tax=Teleopsis dalmanni TaxID=139649 RepID=UPI0018CE8987|nr:probable cytochrome P450 6t1 [Teleopsis dalmanni]